VDESFTEFRDGLNQEYVAAGLGNGNGGPEPDDADKEIIIRRRQDKFSSPEFTQLWSRIRYKARYRVTMNSAVLPEAVARSEYLDRIDDLAHRANVVQAAELVYDDKGQVITSDSVVSEARGEALTIAGQRLPDLVRLVEDQLLATKFPLQLTRLTVRDILAALPSKVKRRAIDDPDRWARFIAAAIRSVTVEEMVNHIIYEPAPEAEWWDAEVIFIEAETQNPSANGDADPSHGVISAPPGGTNLFDHLIYDSHVERNFAALLENDNEHVRLFTKLPRRFRVRTPVGEY
jgi:type III restriction enzyme